MENQPKNEQPSKETSSGNGSDSQNNAKTFSAIKSVSAWVMIISATLFGIIGVLGVWEAFGEDNSDVVWRSISSLGIIAFSSLIVNVAARIALTKER